MILPLKTPLFPYPALLKNQVIKILVCKARINTHKELHQTIQILYSLVDTINQTKTSEELIDVLKKIREETLYVINYYIETLENIHKKNKQRYEQQKTYTNLPSFEEVVERR